MLAVVWQLIRQVISEGRFTFSQTVVSSSNAYTGSTLIAGANPVVMSGRSSSNYLETFQIGSSVIGSSAYPGSLYSLAADESVTDLIEFSAGTLIILIRKSGTNADILKKVAYDFGTNPPTFSELKSFQVGINPTKTCKAVSKTTDINFLYYACDTATGFQVSRIQEVAFNGAGAKIQSCTATGGLLYIQETQQDWLLASGNFPQIFGIKLINPSAGCSTFAGVAGKVRSSSLIAETSTVWDLYTAGTYVYLAKFTFNSGANTLILQQTSGVISNISPVNMVLVPSSTFFLIALQTEIRLFNKNTLTELTPVSILSLTDSIVAGSISRTAFQTNASSFAFSMLVSVSGLITELRNIAMNSTISDCIDYENSLPLTCTRCDVNYLISSDSKACILDSEIPSGYGPDAAAPYPTLALCSDVNCNNCSTTTTSCSSCITGFNLDSSSKICTKTANQSLSLVKAWWDGELHIAKAQFDSLLRCDSIQKSYFNLTIIDQVNHTEIQVKDDKYEITCSNNTIGIKSKDILSNETLKITKNAPEGINPIESIDQKLYFNHFPILIEGMSGPPESVKTSTNASSQFTTASSSLSTTVSLGRSAGSILVSVSRPATGAALDKLVSEFTYLRLVAGPDLIYPDVLLDFVSRADMLPVDVGKVFSEFAEQDSSCVPPQIYVQKEIQCNILTNYSEDLMVTAGMLAINLFVSLTCYAFLNWSLLKNKNSSNLLPRAVNYIYESYGMKFFVSKIDGMAMEMMIFAMINTTRIVAHNPAAIASMALSWIILIYFVLYVAALIKLISDVKKARLKISHFSLAKMQGKPNENITVRQNISKKGLWIFSGALEELRLPQDLMYLYSPVIGIARGLVIAVLIYTTSANPIVQIVLMTLLQVANTAWTVAASIKVSKYDNLKEGADNIMQIVFLILKGFSLLDIDDVSRQKYIGICCTLLLILMLVNNIVFMIVAMLRTILELFRLILNRCNKSKTRLNANTIVNTRTRYFSRKTTEKASLAFTRSEVLKGFRCPNSRAQVSSENLKSSKARKLISNTKKLSQIPLNIATVKTSALIKYQRRGIHNLLNKSRLSTEKQVITSASPNPGTLRASHSLSTSVMSHLTNKLEVQSYQQQTSKRPATRLFNSNSTRSTISNTHPVLNPSNDRIMSRRITTSLRPKF